MIRLISWNTVPDKISVQKNIFVNKYCLSISWSETTSQRHVVKVKTFQFEVGRFDSKLGISAR